MRDNIDRYKPVKLVKFLSFSLKKELADNDFASLQWSIRMGYPRISVFTTNKKTEKFDYNTLITAPFDYLTLFTFLNKCKEIIAGKNGNKTSINCYNIAYNNGVKTDEKILQATVTCGKDDSGVIYLAAIEAGKPKIRFDIVHNDRFYEYLKADGTVETDKGALSVLAATEYISALLHIIKGEMAEDIKTETEIKRRTPGPANPARTNTNMISKKDDTDIEDLL